MTLLDVAGGGTPLAGAAVYLWHCDLAGRYSLYDEEVADENYLRGVQESDADGKVTFKTIFPAAYMGRWPHMHFEVYESLDAATAARHEAAHLAARASRRRRARPCTRRAATSRASRTSRRRRWTPTWCSATATRASSRPSTGSVDDGYTLTLNVGV